MNLRQIEVFRAIMLTGSISGAARVLHVTQPGVSRAAKHIEAQLGVRLFGRSGRRLVPTDDARRLFEEIEKMYRSVLSVQEFARGMRRGEHSRLRIASSPSVGLQLVPAAMAALQKRLPKARLHLDILAGQQLVDLLVTGQVDVGVFAFRADHPMVHTETIARVPLVCAFPPGHALATRRGIGVKDVAGLPFISFGTETYQGRLIDELFAAAGMQIDPVIQVQFGRTACSAVAAGSGVTFVDSLTARYAQTFGIDYRPVRPAVQIEIGLARPRTRGLSSVADAFFDEVKRSLRKFV